MKLIREFVDFKEWDVLNESVNGKKDYRIKGPFLQSEVKNHNGRVYSKKLIEREINTFVKDKINNANGKIRAVGELDHPSTTHINLRNVSHKIESLIMENNNGIGVAKIIDTPTGRIAMTLIDEDILFGVSTRGVGSLNGKNVNEDYKLITIDIVADPSAPNAFVEGILECKDFIIDGNDYVESAVSNLKESVDKSYNSGKVLGYMMDFLKNIEKNK